VIRTQRVPAKPLAVEEAVEQLAVSGDEFLVFTNASKPACGRPLPAGGTATSG